MTSIKSIALKVAKAGNESVGAHVYHVSDYNERERSFKLYNDGADNEVMLSCVTARQVQQQELYYRRLKIGFVARIPMNTGDSADDIIVLANDKDITEGRIAFNKPA